MKRRIVSILLCMFLALGLTSCQKQEPVPTPQPQEEVIERTEPIASFDTVKELKIAIKKDPALYRGKTVSVKGFVNTTIATTWLLDEVIDKQVAVNWYDTVHVTLDINSVYIEHGDYIEVCGIVTESDKGISLKKCTYTMITPYEEKE